MECAVHQTKIQSMYWDCTWVVATITLEVLMWVQRVSVHWLLWESQWYLCWVYVDRIARDSDKNWWNAMENGENCEKAHYYSAKSRAVQKLIKTVRFLLSSGSNTRKNGAEWCADGADAEKLRKILKSEVKGTYPKTKTVLVRELTGELFLCCFKVNTWVLYRGEGGCEVEIFYIRKSEIISKGEQGNTEKSKINQICKNLR